MANELFGTPGGFRAYDEDQRQLADLAGATMLRAGQAEHQRALSGLNNAQAAAMRANAAADEASAARTSAAFSGLAQGGAPSLDDVMARFRIAATLEGQAGNLKGAEDALKTASQVAQQSAAADASKAVEQLRKVRTEKAKYEFVQDRLSAVTDAASYAQARLHILASPIMADADLTDLPPQYDPRWVRAAVANSKAANDKLELQIKQADLARKQNDSGVRNRLADAAFELNKRKTEAYESRVESLNKAGGLAAGSKEKPVGVASPGELKDAIAELKATGMAAADKAEFDHQARQIADEAKYIQSRNKALSASEARAQAIKDAVERGDIKVDTKFLGMGNATKFSASQGSYAKPLALPATQEALQPGRYYRMGDGSIKKYEGPTAAKPVPQSLPRPPANNPLTDDDEE